MIKKGEILRYVVVGVITIGLFTILIILRGGFTGFAVFEDSGIDFNSGTYTNTTYNGSAVILAPENTSGTYTSQIFDATADANWNNISWTQGAHYQQELPDNKQTETNLGGADMTRNILLLHMNEVSGDIVDSSGEGNNFVNNGINYGANGKLNTALEFDGNGDYIEDSDGENYINGITAFTLSVWIKSDITNTDNGFIIGKDPNNNDNVFGMRYDADGNVIKAGITVSGTEQQLESSSNVQITDWQNLVLTWESGQQLKLYINGRLDVPSYNDAPQSGIIGGATKLLIGKGAKDTGNNKGWDGLIDELAIWNRTLSEEEILNIYKRGALKLNLTARTCNDDACSGETWIDLTDTSPQDLSLDNNQYFQYKFGFETDNSSYTPELYNTTIDYTILNTPPSISIVSPQNGNTYGYNESINLNFTISDSENNIDSCWYNLNNQNNLTISNCQNITFDISEGPHTLNIYVNDTNNEQASDSTTFTVQVGAPTITLHSPIDSYLNYNNITFNYTPTDIDLSSCELWGDFNGTLQLNQTNNSPTSGQVNNFQVTLPEGTYLWNIKCTDDQSNQATNGNQTFYIDTTNPSITLTEPTGTKTSKTITTTWTSSDSSPTTCIYNVYRGENTEITNTTINCSQNSATFDVTVDASFTFNFYINDSAGNTNSTSSNFSVDTSTTPPSSGGGGSGGGGGGGGGLILSAKIETSKIGEIIAHSGDKKILSINVKNIGGRFLNNCKLKASEKISSWIYSDQIQGIAPGENTDFVFNLNIPKESQGNFQGNLEIICDEITTSQEINIRIPESLSLIEIKEIKHEDEGLSITYSFNNSNTLGQEVGIEIWILDEQENEIKRYIDSISSEEPSIERKVLIEIPSDLVGIYYVYFARSSDRDNYVKQSVVLGKSRTIGQAILGEGGSKLIGYIVFIIIIGIVIISIKISRGKGKKKISRGKKKRKKKRK